MSHMRHQILGHDDRELRRQVLQAEFYRPLTEELLNHAGITSGMRVLDMGCGVGDVAFLLAERVGLQGEVVGVDPAVEAITQARRRLEAMRWGHVRFVESALSTFRDSVLFDAVVGRLVLMYQPDPVETVRQAAALVRPGGRVVFQELELAALGLSWPKLPLFTWLWEQVVLPTSERAGLALRMGLELVPVLQRAGLQGAEGIVSGRVAAGSDLAACAYMAETVRTVLPLCERLGIEAAAQVEIDTLADRLSEELVASGGVVVPSLLVGAWGHKPG